MSFNLEAVLQTTVWLGLPTVAEPFWEPTEEVHKRTSLSYMTTPMTHQRVHCYRRCGAVNLSVTASPDGEGPRASDAKAKPFDTAVYSLSL